jgi:hypothetical protein
MVRPCVASGLVELVVNGLASMYPASDVSGRDHARRSRLVPAVAEPGEVALRARMLPVEKLDLIEGPPRRAEEQNEPKAIGQIRVSTEIDARIGHG